jgi:TRAP transporter TAXI family solute receptor
MLVLLFALAPPCRAETLIAILTATPSGIWYPLGMTLSSIYAKAMPGANITVQATAGSVANLRLLQSGDGELGFTLGTTLALAWAGNKEAGFDAPFAQLRAIARIYSNFLEIGTSVESGVKTLIDLKGKRVSIGPEGSGTAVDALTIFKAAGFTKGDLANFAPGPFVPSFRKVEQGELEAAMIEGGLGMELVRHLLASGRTRLVPIPPETVAKIANQGYVAAMIPAGTFDGQQSDVPTAGVFDFLVTREGVGDDVAYKMTKLLFEHLDQLVEIQPAAKDIDIKAATVGLPVPLHPGAERYYREVGILK